MKMIENNTSTMLEILSEIDELCTLYLQHISLILLKKLIALQSLFESLGNKCYILYVKC